MHPCDVVYVFDEDKTCTDCIRMALASRGLRCLEVSKAKDPPLVSTSPRALAAIVDFQTAASTDGAFQRFRRFFPSTPVIVTLPPAENVDSLASISFGVAAYLVKPPSLDAVRKAVSQALLDND